MRKFLPPFAVFVLAGALYLTTFTPSVWYADAYNYIPGGIAWHHGGFKLPARSVMDYPGWVALISLLPASRAVPPELSLQLIVGAKLLSIFFAAAASVGVYLVAKKMFASELFACIASALFAANPIIWLEGQSALADVPALAFMVFSFLFFIRFHQGRKYADLALASVLAGAAAVVRVQSLLLLVPYLLGILMIAFEPPKLAWTDRLKRVLPFLAVMCALVFALPLVFFGPPPWILSSTVPLSLPHLDDLLVVAKWYVARNVGWFWFLFAWTGMAVGLVRRTTRPYALMLIAFNAIGVTYFASMNAWQGADIPRYLVPTVPFTLLGMGFLWPIVRTRTAKAAVLMFVVAYVASVFVGLQSPSAAKAEEPPFSTKVFFLQHHLASDAARSYRMALPGMLSDIATAAALPDGAVVIMPGSTLFERHVHARQMTSDIRIVYTTSRLPMPERLQEIASIPEDRQVFVYPGPDSETIESLLMERGFKFRGEVGEVRLFMMDGPASRASPVS